MQTPEFVAPRELDLFHKSDMIHRAYRLLTSENVTLDPSGQQALALLKQHIDKYPRGLMNKPAPAQVIDKLYQHMTQLIPQQCEEAYEQLRPEIEKLEQLVAERQQAEKERRKKETEKPIDEPLPKEPTTDRIAIIIMDDNVQMPRGLTQLLQTENVKTATDTNVLSTLQQMNKNNDEKLNFKNVMRINGSLSTLNQHDELTYRCAALPSSHFEKGVEMAVKQPGLFRQLEQLFVILDQSLDNLVKSAKVKSVLQQTRQNPEIVDRLFEVQSKLKLYPKSDGSVGDLLNKLANTLKKTPSNYVEAQQALTTLTDKLHERENPRFGPSQ